MIEQSRCSIIAHSPSDPEGLQYRRSEDFASLNKSMFIGISAKKAASILHPLLLIRKFINKINISS